jgi:hypothetical protein
MLEILIKTIPDQCPSHDEATFRVLLWTMARVENQDVRKLLIEAIALLASDD